MIGGKPARLIAGVSRLAFITACLSLPFGARAAETAAQPASEKAFARQSRLIDMSIPLVWNGRVLGDVLVQVAPDGKAGIESQSLLAQLTKLLNDAGVVRLREAVAGDPFVTSADLAAAGFDINFDMARLELVVQAIEATYRPIEPLRGRQDFAEPDLPVIEPAHFSAYLNTSANLSYRDTGGLAPPEIFLSGAARYRNFVLEYDGGLAEDQTDRYRPYRRALRAVYDQPETYRRWSAGDLRLANTGTLQTPFIGGVALEKSRRVFDPFAPVVNLGGRQILLTSPSTVEVIVNGASYQTLDLQPGTYSLEDLPIQAGSNDVELVVRDATGREQVTRFDYFFEPIELEAGEDEYTFAAGVLATELDLQPRYSDDPVAIAHYRKALSDTLILGGGIQASQDVQVVSAESRFVPQVIPGSFDLYAAVSSGNGTGFAVRGGYRVIAGIGPEALRFSATFDYNSDNFRTASDFSDFRLESLSLNAIFSKSLSERTSILGGANYLSRSGAGDQSTVFADITHSTRQNLRLTAGLEYGTGSAFGPNFGVRASISYFFGGRHRVDASYQSRRKLARATISRSLNNDVGSLGYSINAQSSDGSTSLDGVVDYISNRFEARGSLATSGVDLGTVTDNRTARLQLGTSFAIADGVFGIGRPIQDAFLLARPHHTLRGTDVITGRSLTGGGYEAASGPLGAAVVSRLSSYNTQDVRYDIDTLNAGYDIGTGVARVDPPYRGGYEIIVGNDRFVSAVGFLQLGEEPAALMAGRITSLDDEGFESQPFFTNSAGRFGVIGLAPGRTYVVRINDSEQEFTIEVPKEISGLLKMGTVRVPTDKD